MTSLAKFGEYVESYRNGYGKRPAQGESGPIVLRIADVSSGFIDLSVPRRGFVSPKDANRYKLLPGNLLFVRVNGAREIVGRCCVVGKNVPKDTVFNDHLIRVRLKPELDPEFARVCVSLPAARAIIEEAAATSAGQLTISQQVLNSIDIPVLALPEQRRIAARLKAQLAAVEIARKAAQAQAADVDALRLATYREAFASIGSAEFVPIGDLARTTSGTTPSRSRKDYWQPPVHPWVKTGEVAFAPIRSTEERVSERALKECSLSLLPVGTVLVAMYGQGKTRGQSALLEVPATTNQACFAILPCESLIPEYLQFWLRHSYEALRETSEARGGNQSNLNGEILSKFEVPVIPLDEQRALVMQIKDAEAAAEKLQRAVADQLADLEVLPARLLAQAFDSPDEGASP